MTSEPNPCGRCRDPDSAPQRRHSLRQAPHWPPAFPALAMIGCRWVARRLPRPRAPLLEYRGRCCLGAGFLVGARSRLRDVIGPRDSAR